MLKTQSLTHPEDDCQSFCVFSRLNLTPWGFKDHSEKHKMRKIFDYEDRVLVDANTGEATMKLYYLHPSRMEPGEMIYCGCYFSAVLWKEYKTISNLRGLGG